MHIQSIYIYPIKSLRGTTIPSSELTPYGFPHDRRFALLRDHGKDESKNPLKSGRWEHLSIAKQPELGLFVSGIEWAKERTNGAPNDNAGTNGALGTREDGHPNGIAQDTSAPTADADEDDASPSDILTVTHTSPTTKAQSTTRIPLQPSLTNLEPINLKIHQSPTAALLMPSQYAAWFSERLGYNVSLAYLGLDNYRPVLGNLAPNATSRNKAWQAAQTAKAEREEQTTWLQKLTAGLPGLSTITADAAEDIDPGYEIGFADCSPYMLVNAKSFEEVAARFPADDPLEIEKFRPNVVVAGAGEAFEEDFWGEVVFRGSGGGGSGGSSDGGIDGGIKLQLTSNCVRCTSLNVDWATGKFGQGEKGSVLKTLAKDRRVDKGHKYSPVFGRYGFLVRGAEKDGLRVSVGDEVLITRRNEERTVFRWPGIGQTKKDDLYPVEDVGGVQAA